MLPHYCDFCFRSFSTWWAILDNKKTSRRYRTWIIVNNRFCWLLGVVVDVKNRRHSVKEIGDGKYSKILNNCACFELNTEVILDLIQNVEYSHSTSF